MKEKQRVETFYKFVLYLGLRDKDEKTSDKEAAQVVGQYAIELLEEGQLNQIMSVLN